MTDNVDTPILPTEISLGVKVKDPTTGVEGIVCSRSDVIGGNIQWGVQPYVFTSGLGMPESYFIDEHLLIITGPGLADKVPPVATTDTLNVGEAVKDIVTGFKGVATERITYLNGCIRYLVQAKLKKGEVAYKEGVVLNHLTLVKTGPGITKAIAQKTAPKAKKKAAVKKKKTTKPPGGPTRKAY